MSFGKMHTPIMIVESSTVKDAEGYSVVTDRTIASTRAYKESRHANEVWKNRAAFSEASCLFRFRVIPGLTVTTSHAILCDGQRYRILSVEDVRDKKMYIECLADRVSPSVR